MLAQTKSPAVAPEYHGDEFGRIALERSKPVGIDPVEFTLDGRTGTFAGKPILDKAGVIDHLTTPYSQDVRDGVITYSFANSAHATGWLNSPGLPQFDGGTLRGGYGWAPFTAEQEAAARLSIQMWDDLIAPSFREVNGQGQGSADIVFANTLSTSQAFAYYPQSFKGNDSFTGDVFVQQAADNWTNAWFGTGGYGSTTLTHEIGHSIGLSHPGAYNYNPNLPLSYANNAEYAQDSMQYTIMSYWGAENTDRVTGATRILVDWNTFFYHNPQSPLLHDILAIQSVYGADVTTRVGDTTYGFGSTAGLWIYDFEQNPYPYMAIYDAGGIDTIDASGFTASQFIDLHAGAFSSIGDGYADAATVNAARAELAALSGQALGPLSQASINANMQSYMNLNGQLVAADTGIAGINASNHDNVAIAFGTTIENAIGGSARDLLYGNEVANRLEGRGGDDVIRGFEGNDTLLGDTGADTLLGDAGDDLLVGGLGADRMTGGAGADTFKFGDLEIGDVITDFNQGQGDIIDLSSLGGNLHFIGAGGFSGSAGEVNYVNGLLSADTDGNGIADFSVSLSGLPPINVDHLVLHA